MRNSVIKGRLKANAKFPHFTEALIEHQRREEAISNESELDEHQRKSDRTNVGQHHVLFQEVQQQRLAPTRTR